jgi:Zn-dependent protease
MIESTQRDSNASLIVVSRNMHDPFSWSLPFGRLFGITIRIHILFPFVALGFILQAAFKKDAVPGAWLDVSYITLVLFVSVLLHEFGHCFGARAVNGDAQEVLMWPLGGLASVDVPHTPRANFITTVCGPAVNFVLCLLALLGLYLAGSYQPNWNPTAYLGRQSWGGLSDQVVLKTWSGDLQGVAAFSVPVLIERVFWVNYMLFLLNLLPGFPLDGGRMFQSVAWKYLGYRRATLAAVYAGFVTMFVLGLYAIIVTSIMAVFLGLFMYVECRRQYLILEGGGEDSLFGYDFSQGYTSLEREEAPTAPPRRRKSWFQRWRERRAAMKAQREEEIRIADERRLDELLEKVQREGMGALTEEERRFMKRVSDRYRKRPSP